MPGISPLVIVLAITLLISPFVIALSIRKDKKTKQNLRLVWIGLLTVQVILGIFNWESFSGSGRSGFELAISYPSSLLGLIFIAPVVQIIFLLLNKMPAVVVVLNFLSSVIIFSGLIRLSSILGEQIVSLGSIGAVFTILIGNIIGLIFINKDPKLLSKYFFLKSS